MAISFSAVFSGFNSLVEWFLPQDAREDRELVKHMRMYIITHILGPFLGNSVPAALYYFDPKPGIDVAVLAIAITCFWIGPFILRMSGKAYYALAVISLQNLMFCVLWSCYFYGGVTSPTLPWVLVIPLHVIFYVGSARILRIVMLGMFVANLAVFYGFSSVYGLPQHNVPFTSLQGLGLVSTAAASLYTAMMAFFYAKVAASHSELEREMREHLATANQLRKATDEAERAGAAKAEFLAKMSHELRTPLNAVIGYSQILLEDAQDEDDPETISDLQKIHAAGRHLLKLVNEVLDLIKIEAGKMQLYCEHFDLSEVVCGIESDLKEALERNGSVMKISFEAGLPQLYSDRSRLHDAVFELAENAVKFTKSGMVEIRGRSEKDGFGEGRDALIVEVRDSGIGIPASHLPVIFEQFNVLSDASTSKYGGTGLGLALTRSICRLLGGDIAVTSEENIGSCFTIRVPIEAPQISQPEDDEEDGAESSDDVANLPELAEAEEAVERLKNTIERHMQNSSGKTKVVANG
ncbi:MAG: sensor histidine kinase [Beijerinckiaceae bacterium]